MTRKKKKIGLPIMAGTLAVLAIGYICLTNYQANKEEEESIQASLEEEANTVYLNKMEDIVSIRYISGTTELAFEKKDEEWVVKDLTDFPLEQSYLEKIETVLQSLTATRKFESPDAIEGYGLDEPVLTVEATDAQGKEFSICFGSSYNSEYYVAINNDESVIYTTDDSLLTATEYELYDMIVLEEIPTLTEINIETVELKISDDIYLVKREKKVMEGETESKTESETEENVSEAEEETELGSETEVTTEEVTTWYVSKNGGECKEMSNEEKDELIYMIANMEIVNCVNYKANETELEHYGLGKNSITMTITYELEEETKTIVFHIGNLDAENAVYYVTMGDSAAINQVEEDILAGLVDGTMEILN